MNEGDAPLLQVRNLEKQFSINTGIMGREIGHVKAVDGISFSLDRGETFGLVGESGCGKSTAAKSIMRLIKPTGGSVLFDGVDVNDMNEQERRTFRRRTQIIFQNPDSSFDPRMTIGESVAEPLRVNGMKDRDRRRSIVEGLLRRVGLEGSDADRYPHEFSGGQKQRIGLARALAVNPDLLVADEPVSALDVSIQAEILSLMQELQDEFDLAILIISHNLGVIRQICDNVGVMYVGEIVERGPADAVFTDPQHPYTQALLSSMPTPDPHLNRTSVELTGDVPSPASPPPGCRFHTRCPQIIPPDSLDIEQSTWRRVMDVAQQIYTESIDPDGIRESVITMDDATGIEPEEVDFEAFAKRLREEYDVPEHLGSASLESTLEQATRAVFDDEIENAKAVLNETFSTPCRTEVPEEMSVGPDHVASCHLLEAETEQVAVSSATED